jgi:bifunctional oligoribonuclease and PAP phosphatase NrnA
MTIGEAAFDRAVELLGHAQEAEWEVALACHVDPDGDALGSMLALARFLHARGVDVVVSYATSDERGDHHLEVPAPYRLLPGLEHLVAPDAFPERPELMIVFDCATAERLGSLAPVAEHAGTVLVIDHHASGLPFGDVRLVDPGAAATAVLVEDLLRRAGGALDRETATCLYVALVTDTGRFQYASTTPAVMELGARLMDAGIDHEQINRRIWNTHSMGYLKVLGRALQRTRLLPAASLAWTAVYQDDLSDFSVDPAELDGVIDVVRGVENAECCLVAKEQPSGSWKVSLRARDGIDVGRLVSAFGGGGHACAAGFTYTGPLEELVERVTARLEPAHRAQALAS